jgi:hypothetical protein
MKGGEPMRKIRVSLILVFGIFSCLSSANAALLGVDLLLPEILSNQAGNYTYSWEADLEQGLFISRATPLTVTFDGLNLEPIPGQTEYVVSFWLDGSGNFKSGVAQDDLVISGTIDSFSGDLLTGEVVDFGWFNVPESSIAIFDFIFQVTGGIAAEVYQGLAGDVMTAEMSNFSGDWQADHQGTKVKHNTAPVVPIPATVWLLGAGLMGLVGMKKRFQR